MNITLIGPSLNQRGGIVSVISGLRDFLTQKHVNIRTIGTTADGSIWKIISTFIQAWLITLSLCLLRKTDVIHLHIASRGSCLRKSTLALTCWMLRTPFILHLHGAEFQAFYNNELPFIGRQFVKFIFRRAARVIALSNSWQDWLNVTLKLKNVTVVFNGVPTIATTNVPKQNTILFLGRLGPRKGTDELISAMRMVIRNFPDAVLELGGDGDIDHYRQQAGNLPNIRFLGWIDDNERAAALSRANIFCLPSWNEGLPMSVLEAMSAGLPVVSTPVGGIPEAVETNVTGLLVRTGDVQGLAAALCGLLDNPDFAKTLGCNGKARHREKFSTTAMGTGCLEVYSSCITR